MRQFGSDALAGHSFDYFSEAREEFAGVAKTQRVIGLIEYCQQRSRILDLLAALQRECPEQYEKAFGPGSAVKSEALKQFAHTLGKERDFVI